MACITEVGDRDLAALALDDFLASAGLMPEASVEYQPLLRSAVILCGSRFDLPRERLADGFGYTRRFMVGREALRRLEAMGVSAIFIDEMVGFGRAELNGSEVADATNEAFARELGRGVIDAQDDALIAHLLVPYIDWVIHQDEFAPPA